MIDYIIPLLSSFCNSNFYLFFLIPILCLCFISVAVRVIFSIILMR